MKFLEENLEQFIEHHTSPEPEYLYELNRETNLKVSKPQMLSGHLQGKALAFFSHMIKPKQVLEIGTYTGYSAICLAQGLADDGLVHTIDNNEELEPIARRYWQKAGLENWIKFHKNTASDLIPTLEGPFDMVFIDADKEHYSLYYDQVLDKVKQGGLIIADNVLWSGKVLNDDPDKETAALKAFNNKVHADGRVENLLLPLRDGLMMIRKL